jgi:hypothetical protein
VPRARRGVTYVETTKHFFAAIDMAGFAALNLVRVRPGGLVVRCNKT